MVDQALPQFPVDQPVTVHTHQVLEQQLIQEHTQKTLGQDDAVGDAQQPPMIPIQPEEEPAEPQLPELLAFAPTEQAAEDKKKRRKRRRGRRKGQKAGDAANEPDEDSDELSQAGDGVSVRQNEKDERKDEGKNEKKHETENERNESAKTSVRDSELSNSTELWRPRLGHQPGTEVKTDPCQDSAMPNPEAKEVKEVHIVQKASVPPAQRELGARPSEWRPSLSRLSAFSKRSEEELKRSEGFEGASQKASSSSVIETVTSEPKTEWQPSLKNREKNLQFTNIGTCLLQAMSCMSDMFLYPNSLLVLLVSLNLTTAYIYIYIFYMLHKFYILTNDDVDDQKPWQHWWLASTDK